MTRICPDNDLPTICSSCRQSPARESGGPKLGYVDFQAQYDGPVVNNPDNPTETPVYVENIVICENCIREAAALIGMADSEAMDEYRVQAEAHMDQQDAEIKEKDRAISNLSHTVGTLLDHPVKRPAGRPQLVGPESHEEQIADLRSKRSRKERVAKALTSGADGD
jgi:hypothetical protein